MGYNGLGYAGHYGYAGYGYATPYYGGVHYYGKRSADAEPKAEADPYVLYSGLGYAGHYGYGLGYAGYPYTAYSGLHYYGKRSADAEPKADAYYGYSGYARPYGGYYGYARPYGYAYYVKCTAKDLRSSTGRRDLPTQQYSMKCDEPTITRSKLPKKRPAPCALSLSPSTKLPLAETVLMMSARKKQNTE